MPLNKNHSARLRRVDQRLDRSLDSLMQANGELWPKELRVYGEKLQTAVDTLRSLSSDIAKALSDEPANAAPEPAEDGQTDLEDFTQGEPSHIEDIEGDEPAPATSRRRRSSAA